MLVEARRVAADIGELLGVAVDADTMLAGRAALLNLGRPGRISAGGATRLLPTSDGWCAVALPRDDDVAALPAVLEVDAVADPWAELSRWAATRSAADVVKRTQLLDIAAAALGEASAGDADRPALRPHRPPATSRRATGRRFVVAVGGPAVCAASGPRGRHRRQGGKPEAARRHPPWRAGVLRLDECRKALLRSRLRYASDALRRLLGVADIVIEGSRPAALRRRQLDAENVAGRPGRIWLRINGYHDQPGRPAFGDDAAVAGGLVGDGPVFLGDAIADPLSGLEAARAIGESLRRGGGEVIDVAMAQVAARYAAMPDVQLPRGRRRRRCRRHRRWAPTMTVVDRLVAERC